MEEIFYSMFISSYAIWSTRYGFNYDVINNNFWPQTFQAQIPSQIWTFISNLKVVILLNVLKLGLKKSVICTLGGTEVQNCLRLFSNYAINFFINFFFIAKMKIISNQITFLKIKCSVSQFFKVFLWNSFLE